MKIASVETRNSVSSSRRNFLKVTATAAIGGGLMLGFGVPARGEVRDTLTTDAPFAPNAFLRIDRAGLPVLDQDMAELERYADFRAADPASMHHINLGGIHHRPGRRERLPYLYLTDEELKLLIALEAAGADVQAQDLPSSAPVQLRSLS